MISIKEDSWPAPCLVGIRMQRLQMEKTMQMKLLIADDNSSILNACLQAVLRPLGSFQVTATETPEGCLREIGLQSFDFILLDISFTSGQREGIKLIPSVRRLAPDAEIIMLTSFDDTETIALCMSAGANDYISKNNLDSITEMTARMRSALNRRINRANDSRSGLALARQSGASFASPAMREVYAQVSKVRNEQRMHVLITGPTGAGKELVARAIARESDNAPFHRINCSSFGKDMLETELFGHERGSFTGAERQKLGLFELANGGDIFFDEVATLSLEHQAKLLRVLQSGEFYRTGGTKILKTTARVIAATNEDLEDMVRQGKFREDLLMRFRRYHITLPSLKDRKEDIPIIVESIISKSKKPQVKITSDCLKILSEYCWPRNVRELEDCVLAMIMNCDGAFLTVGDLPRKFFSNAALIQTNQKSSNGFVSEIPWGLSMEAAQKAFMASYIGATAQRMTEQATIGKLAKSLDMSKSTLARKLNELQISL